MFKKNISYVDYDGNKRNDEFYFNLNKAELMTLEFSYKGGIAGALQQSLRDHDMKTVMDIVTTMIKMSYGAKSADGRKFVKSPSVLEDFEFSEAYPTLLMDLVTNEGELDKFMTGIMPADLQADVRAQIAKQREAEEKNAKIVPVDATVQ